MKSKIQLKDYIYLCIINGIVLISILSITLGDSDRAGEKLSFGATVVSIVLAVIAIVLTIVDSAGQRQNLIQMKEAITDLRDSVDEVKTLVYSTKNNLIEVRELKEEFMRNVTENDRWKQEISDLINKFSNNNTVSMEDVLALQKKLNSQINSKTFDVKSLSFRLRLNISDNFKLSLFISQLKNQLFSKQGTELVYYEDITKNEEDSNTRELLLKFIDSNNSFDRNTLHTLIKQINDSRLDFELIGILLD